MWKLIDSKKLDVLKMTQDNLEATQKNNQLLAEFLAEQLSRKTPQEEFAEKIDILKLTQNNLDAVQKSNLQATELLKEGIADKDEIIKQTQTSNQQMIDIVKEELSDKMQILKQTQDNLDAIQKSNSQATELLKDGIADKDEIIKQTQISNQQMIDIVKEELSDKMQILKQTQDNLDAIQKNNQQLVEISKEEFTDKIDVLKMTQENLDATQKNNQLLTGILLSQLTANNQEVPQKTPEEIKKEQRKAAYALNLCTVSVSQIIDYNDIYFLDREYDAILNNLNLEKMPKDEALLRILKQLLDVITFFRIQEGERKMMEKEYAQKIKNAIWSAVPNPAVLVTGGNPAMIVASLVSQVGIGYMNYRKEKAQINQEKERKEWELQRSAMEQFNGLRRELFDTAWRLADEYDFPDELRITERQITQYNNILLDTNDLRRYERLEYIQKKFEAYPPFLYNIGNAASAVYHDKKYPEEIRKEYKKKAIEHFNEFFENTKENILREDQLVASCALEKFALIEDKAEKIELLQRAEKSSGNALDVLQICAFSYLDIGEFDKAANLFNMLVNEGYNEKLNAQVLSKIYVSKVIENKGDSEKKYRNEYSKLASRTMYGDCLYPLPSHRLISDEGLNNKFILKQRDSLKRNYSDVVGKYIFNCQAKYNAICKQSGNITSEMAVLIKSMAEAFEFLLQDVYAKNSFMDAIKKIIEDKDCPFKRMLENGDERINGTSSVSFDEFFKEPLEKLPGMISSKILGMESMSHISKYESTLNDFVLKYNIALSDDSAKENFNTEMNSIDEIFGDEYLQNVRNSQKVDRFVALMNNKNYNEDELLKKKSEKDELIIRGEMNFVSFINDHKKLNKSDINKDTIFAILRSDRNPLLIFTTDSLVMVKQHSLKKPIKIEYTDVTSDSQGKKLYFSDNDYDNENVDLEKLFEMIKDFAELTNSYNKADAKSLATQIKKRIINA